MRAISTSILMVFGAATLAACGTTDRQAMIDQGIEQCMAGANQSGGMGGIDSRRVCTCALNKMTDGKSAEEVRAMMQQDEPTAADLEAMGACLVEEMGKQGFSKG